MEGMESKQPTAFNSFLSKAGSIFTLFYELTTHTKSKAFYAELDFFSWWRVISSRAALVWLLCFVRERTRIPRGHREVSQIGCSWRSTLASAEGKKNPIGFKLLSLQIVTPTKFFSAKAKMDGKRKFLFFDSTFPDYGHTSHFMSYVREKKYTVIIRIHWQLKHHIHQRIRDPSTEKGWKMVQTKC